MQIVHQLSIMRLAVLLRQPEIAVGKDSQGAKIGVVIGIIEGLRRADEVFDVEPAVGAFMGAAGFRRG